MAELPDGFTKHQVYAGYVIAIGFGYFHVFTPTLARFPEKYTKPWDARRAIDADILYSNPAKQRTMEG